MTNSIKRKLHSNRGASMMLALALMLFCVMVSSVIVAAAASGSSRGADRKKQQQEYLAVSSAANLVAEELQQIGEFSGERTKIDFGCQTLGTGNVEHGNQDYFGWDVGVNTIDGFTALKPTMIGDKCTSQITATSVDTQMHGAFKELIYEATCAIYQGATQYTDTFEIAPKFVDERLPKVKCYLVMDNQYNISIELSTEEGDYTITVLVAAIDGEEITSTPDTETICCYHLVYYRKLNPDGSYTDGESPNYSFGATKTSTYNKITWQKPQIIKGGISE